MKNQRDQIVDVKTPVFRLAYPALFTPRKINPENQNEVPKYSLTMLIPPAAEQTEGDKAALAAMKRDVARLCQAHLGDNWAEIIKKRKGDGSPMYRMPFQDGASDSFTNETGKPRAGFGPGITVVRASTKLKPGVVDARLQPIVDPSEVYAGCYARASVYAYWYEVNGNTGVTFNLGNVQKVRDGEPFSGRKKAEDEFEAIAMPTPADATPDNSNDPFQ